MNGLDCTLAGHIHLICDLSRICAYFNPTHLPMSPSFLVPEFNAQLSFTFILNIRVKKLHL